MNPHLTQIEFRASVLGSDTTEVFKDFILNYPEFERWSGSHNPLLHHYGKGGLARHTFEVMDLAFRTRATLHIEEEVDGPTLFFAAVFHDVGKLFDYIEVNGEWKPTDHRRLIHHLSESAMIWDRIIHKFPHLVLKYRDPVVHAILAHHGSRNHGSPIFPRTRVAWLVHLCDGLSARMDDCERLDHLEKPA